MKLKAISGIMLTLLLMGTLTLAFNIQPVKSELETIYIRADGSVEPSTAPIKQDGDLYTLTGNIASDGDGIVIERNNMTLDGVGYTLQGTGAEDSKGISLSGRSNVTIKNMEIKSFDDGIYLRFMCVWESSSNSLNNTICGNNITNNERGITLIRSSNNTIYGNNITANFGYGTGAGIYLLESSNNSISRNHITNNFHGIYLLYSLNNSIYRNYISANDAHGIWIGYSSNNIICHNDFVDNSPYSPTEQVDSDNSTNVWDDGYPSGGNYWSDYADRYPDAKEIDDSGIWDNPYIIDEDNQDNYPLMNQLTPSKEAPPPAEEEETPLWMQWWLWAIVVVVVVASAGAVYLLKKRKPPTPIH